MDFFVNTIIRTCYIIIDTIWWGFEPLTLTSLIWEHIRRTGVFSYPPFVQYVFTGFLSFSRIYFWNICFNIEYLLRIQLLVSHSIKYVLTCNNDYLSINGFKHNLNVNINIFLCNSYKILHFKELFCRSYEVMIPKLNCNFK